MTTLFLSNMNSGLVQAGVLSFALFQGSCTSERGPQGLPGSPGPQGPRGSDGRDGLGTMGIAGPQGSAGPDGPMGSAGPQGPTGPQGPDGPSCSVRDGYTLVCPDGTSRNVRGPQGERGPVGMTGLMGPMGMTGPRGYDGTPGARGPQGSGFDPSSCRIDVDSITIVPPELYRGYWVYDVYGQCNLGEILLSSSCRNTATYTYEPYIRESDYTGHLEIYRGAIAYRCSVTTTDDTFRTQLIIRSISLCCRVVP